MYTPTGIAVGIPLTLLQGYFGSVHHGSLYLPTAATVASNFALAHCVYDADRLRDVEPGDQGFYPVTTTFSMIVPMTYYFRDVHTLPLIGVLLYLRYFYADSKLLVSSVKPMFVSLIWVLCVYGAPQIIEYHTLDCFDDIMTPLTCFLMLSGWSNMADIPDMEEDVKNDVYTRYNAWGRGVCLRFPRNIDVCVCISLFLVRTIVRTMSS